jgi:hypothetical protein
VRVLIACEFSGVVRDAFRARGHDAWSCDLSPSTAEFQGPHLEGDVRWWLDGRNAPAGGWDLMIAHPPCTYLCSSGLHWNKRRPERAEQTEQALAFVRELLDAPIPMICVENPIGCISTRIRKPDQIIQPHEFGDDASKTTCLWLKNLPPLLPTRIPSGTGRVRRGRERWANQTDSGQNKLAPSADRWAQRSITYPGIAQAMAAQWG